MKYDFETSYKRIGVGSGKWDKMKELVPDISDEVVPFSVADMELKNPPEIIRGLQKYLEHVILGYTGATDAYYEAVQNWMERRHGYRPKKEWFVLSDGVVPAVSQMVKALTEPRDSVMITTPVYYPFKNSIEGNGRKVVNNEMKIVNGRYEIDFEDFTEKAKRPEVTMYIMCSPHNPVGRVWSREDVQRIAEICLENHVFIICDEIHSDLIMPGHTFTSMGTLEEKYVNNCAICTAPSKTFNLAGLKTSNIFVPNEAKRKKLTSAQGYFSLNIFGYKACELAYNECEEWLEQLLVHIDGNRRLVEDFMAEHLPQIKVCPLEGTYLLWMDFRALGMDEKQLEEFMIQKANWFTDEGYVFGEGGKGFERLNLACTRPVLLAALERLLAAVKAL